MLQVALLEPGSFAAQEVQPPTAAAGDALVRVHRVGVCGTDLHAFRGNQPFFTFPRVLGHELAVEVVEPGEGAALGLKAGDRCSVEPYLHCGRCIACRHGKPNCCTELKVLGVHIDGGMRPLLAVPPRKLHRSTRLSYDQLALVEMLAIGAHAVERTEIQEDDFVLVVGAGPIGMSAIPFARLAAKRVAAMDVSAPRRQFCLEHGKVDAVLAPGPRAVDELREIGGGDLPTVVIDATGHQGSMAASFELAASGGRIVFVGIYRGDIAFNDPNFHRRELTLCASRNATPATFRNVLDRMEAGEIDPARWITHRFRLEETPVKFPAVASDSTAFKAMIEV